MFKNHSKTFNWHLNFNGSIKIHLFDIKNKIPFINNLLAEEKCALAQKFGSTIPVQSIESEYLG